MKISAAESAILELLFSAGEPVPAETIIQMVGPGSDWSPATVRTFLTRLVKKKAAAVTKEGRRYLYRPLLDRAAYVQSESQGLLDRLFGGQLTPMVHHFAEHGALTPEELEKLKALIEKMERKHG